MNTLREIWDAIMRNKMRTAATGIAVASGIFLLIVLLGASNGIIHTLEQNESALSLNTVHVWPGVTTIPYHGLSMRRAVKLREGDAQVASRQFPHQVDGAVTTLNEAGKTVSVGHKHLTVDLVGITPDYALISSNKLLRGRFVNAADLSARRKVAVLTETEEEFLFGAGQGLAQYVNVNGSMFLVVGITEKDFAFGGNDMLVPATTLQTIYGRGDQVDQLSLAVENLPTEESNEQFVDELRATMGGVHEFDANDQGALWIWNTAADSAALGNAKNILSTSFWVLGLLTLLSGVVGVSNIMLIAVKERTHEFGIRKALGAKPWSIIRMVMLESVLITTFFGYIGMVLGVMFCEWMDASVGGQVMDAGVFQQKYFVDPTVDLGICIRATAVMVVAGALAGFFPARKAAKVKPIEALRG